MKEEGMEPLSVVLVWNETDQTSVEKYIQYTTKMLSRDINEKPNPPAMLGRME